MTITAMTAAKTTEKAKPAPISRADIKPGLWSTKTVFRHGQCDPAGIVYTPKFFDVFNQMIEAWFCERLGINYYDIIGKRRIGLGYGTASATFFSPCMMGDEIEIFIDVARIGSKSYTLILHAFKDGREALRGEFVTVATSLDLHQAIAIPEDIRQALVIYSQSANR